MKKPHAVASFLSPRVDHHHQAPTTPRPHTRDPLCNGTMNIYYRDIPGASPFVTFSGGTKGSGTSSATSSIFSCMESCGMLSAVKMMKNMIANEMVEKMGYFGVRLSSLPNLIVSLSLVDEPQFGPSEKPAQDYYKRDPTQRSLKQEPSPKTQHFPSKTLSASLKRQASTMASLILGALPIPTQTLTFSSRISFSQSETLSISLPPPQLRSQSPQLPLHQSLQCTAVGAIRKPKEESVSITLMAMPRNKNKGRGPPRVPVPVAPPKKDKFEDDTVVKVEIDESLS
ncbi:plastid-specific ribosomal protein 4 [Prunus dulcis]|uniref:Plastid-specific ribosomal protein 4 n=1 Tax=Prunus dulcis TaxID=3755 RepID=A0A4Y1RQS5_PRUDU|nr:plastid-specific ribosomal protein 4 [Prunus dulcis]